MWDDEAGMPKENSPVDGLDGFYTYSGAKASATGSVKVSFSEGYNLAVELRLRLTLEAGIGFKVANELEYSEPITLGEVEFPFGKQLEINILSIEFKAGIKYFVRADLADIKIDLPSEYMFYQGIKISTNIKARATTFSGITSSVDPTAELLQPENNGFEDEGIDGDYSISISPRISIGLKAYAAIGSFADISMEAGGRYTSTLTLGWNNSLCYMPSLYGTRRHKVDIYVTTPECNWEGRDDPILESHEFSLTIFDSGEGTKHCVIGDRLDSTELEPIDHFIVTALKSGVKSYSEEEGNVELDAGILYYTPMDLFEATTIDCGNGYQQVAKNGVKGCYIVEYSKGISLDRRSGTPIDTSKYQFVSYHSVQNLSPEFNTFTIIGIDKNGKVVFQPYNSTDQFFVNYERTQTTILSMRVPPEAVIVYFTRMVQHYFFNGMYVDEESSWNVIPFAQDVKSTVVSVCHYMKDMDYETIRTADNLYINIAVKPGDTGIEIQGEGIELPITDDSLKGYKYYAVPLHYGQNLFIEDIDFGSEGLIPFVCADILFTKKGSAPIEVDMWLQCGIYQSVSGKSPFCPDTAVTTTINNAGGNLMFGCYGIRPSDNYDFYIKFGSSMYENQLMQNIYHDIFKGQWIGFFNLDGQGQKTVTVCAYKSPIYFSSEIYNFDLSVEDLEAFKKAAEVSNIKPVVSFSYITPDEEEGYFTYNLMKVYEEGKENPIVLKATRDKTFVYNIPDKIVPIKVTTVCSPGNKKPNSEYHYKIPKGNFVVTMDSLEGIEDASNSLTTFGVGCKRTFIKDGLDIHAVRRWKGHLNYDYVGDLNLTLVASNKDGYYYNIRLESNGIQIPFDYVEAVNDIRAFAKKLGSDSKSSEYPPYLDEDCSLNVHQKNFKMPSEVPELKGFEGVKINKMDKTEFVLLEQDSDKMLLTVYIVIAVVAAIILALFVTYLVIKRLKKRKEEKSEEKDTPEKEKHHDEK